MKKQAVFIKVKELFYRLNEASEGSFFTLFMFLGDGLYRKTYFEFLEDSDEQEFYGNVSRLHKNGNEITVRLHDEIIPEAPPFTTSIENMCTILKQWDQLRLEGVETISLTLDKDELTMMGS